MVHAVICLFLIAYFLFQGYDLSFQKKKRNTTQPCPPTTPSPPSSCTLFLDCNYSSFQLQRSVRITWSGKCTRAQAASHTSHISFWGWLSDILSILYYLKCILKLLMHSAGELHSTMSSVWQLFPSPLK